MLYRQLGIVRLVAFLLLKKFQATSSFKLLVYEASSVKFQATSVGGLKRQVSSY